GGFVGGVRPASADALLVVCARGPGQSGLPLGPCSGPRAASGVLPRMGALAAHPLHVSPTPFLSSLSLFPIASALSLPETLSVRRRRRPLVWRRSSARPRSRLRTALLPRALLLGSLHLLPPHR